MSGVTKMTSLTEDQAVKNSFTTEQLQEGLYHLVDILDRCICPFIFLGETARSVIEEDKIQGDGIYGGVRAKEYTDSVKSMLQTLSSNVDIRLGIDGFKATDQGLFWTFKGIPINIKLIHGKYTYFENPDQIFYWGELYQIPNSFDKYYKVRNLIK